MANHLAAKGFSVVSGLWNEDEEKPQTECLYGDINDSSYLDRILDGVSLVYHFAGSTNPQSNKYSFGDELEQTLVPLMRIVDSCKKNKVERIVFPSSGGTVYRKDIDECFEDSPLLGESPYANSKIASEFILRQAALREELSATVFRIGNPYGPGQIAKPGQGVVAHWIDAIMNSQPLVVFGNELVSRDFIFVDDACDLMEVATTLETSFDVLNIASGHATSLKQIYETLESVSGKKIEIKIQQSRLADRDSICLNVDKVLSHKPKFEFTSLQDGLKKAMDSSGVSSKS